MQIRADQMQALDTAVLDRFVGEMCAFLRATLPEKTVGATEAQLQMAVRKAINQGGGFEIEERFDIQQYLKIVFELDYLTRGAESIDWAKGFLSDKAIPAADKVNRLEGEAMLLGWLKR
jgi:hypothetical protein